MSEQEKKLQEEIVEDAISEDVEQSNSSVEKSDDAVEKSEIEIANEKISSLTDKLMRTAAEYDNYKKRTAREKDDLYKIAVCDTVAPLLNILDNLERAVSAAEASDESSVLDGIKMIKKQFDDTLASIGVAPIDALDCEFNPELHNAVMTGESDAPTNTIIEEFQKGYIYKDKVIRHSMVKVSN